MEKIPTLFLRDEKTKKVIPVVNPAAAKLLEYGYITEKLDGTNVRVTTRNCLPVRLEKRRNPTGDQKVMGIIEPWYVDCTEGKPDEKHIWNAFGRTNFEGWPDGEHSCEAIGPGIQGNPLGLETPRLVSIRFQMPRVLEIGPRTFESLRELVLNLDSVLSPGHPAEGIVIHDVRYGMVKLKRKDF